MSQTNTQRSAEIQNNFSLESQELSIDADFLQSIDDEIILLNKGIKDADKSKLENWDALVKSKKELDKYDGDLRLRKSPETKLKDLNRTLSAAIVDAMWDHPLLLTDEEAILRNPTQFINSNNYNGATYHNDVLGKKNEQKALYLFENSTGKLREFLEKEARNVLYATKVAKETEMAFQKGEVQPGHIQQSAGVIAQDVEEKKKQGFFEKLEDKAMGAFDWGKKKYDALHKKSPVLAYAAVGLSGFVLYKFAKLFIPEKKSESSNEKSGSGLFDWFKDGITKKILMTLGLGGAGGILAWKSPEIMKSIGNMFSNFKSGMIEKTLYPILKNIPFISDQQAKEMARSFAYGEKEKGKEGETETSESDAPGLLETLSDPEKALNTWWGNKKTEIEKWMGDRKFSKDAIKAVVEIDIQEAAKGYKGDWHEIIGKTGTATGTLFAMYLFRRQIAGLAKFLVKRIAFRHPLIFTLSLLGVSAFGFPKLSDAKSALKEEVDFLFADEKERSLVKEEIEFFSLVHNKVAVSKDFLNEVGGMRFLDMMNMGANTFEQAGEAMKDMFDFEEDWHKDFSTLYNLFTSERIRDAINEEFFEKYGNDASVSTLLLFLFGKGILYKGQSNDGEQAERILDSDLYKNIVQRDEELKGGSITEGVKEFGEWELHDRTAAIINRFSDTVKGDMEKWDEAHPNMKGTVTRFTKVMSLLSKAGVVPYLSEGLIMFAQGAKNWVVLPFSITGNLVKAAFPGGETWEDVSGEVAQDAATLAAIGGTVGVIRRFIPGIKTNVGLKAGAKAGVKQILFPARLAWALRHYDRAIPRVGMVIDDALVSKIMRAKTKLANITVARNAAALQEHAHLVKRLENLKEEKLWLQKTWRRFGEGRVFSVNSEADEIFKSLAKLEGSYSIPEAKQVSPRYRSWWNSPQLKMDVKNIKVEKPLKSAKKQLKKLQKVKTPTPKELQEIHRLKGFTTTELPKLSRIDDLSEATYVQKLQAQAQEVFSAQKGVEEKIALMRDKLQSKIDSGASKKEIKPLKKELKKVLYTFGEQKKINIKMLNTAYKNVPHDARTPELRKAVRNAIHGGAGSILKTRMKGAGIMAVAMVGVDTLLNWEKIEKDPVKELGEIWGRLGPNLKQLLLDSLPVAGTLSNFYSAGSGKEVFTDVNVGGAWHRTSNLAFGVIGLGLDAAMIGSLGAGTPIILGTRIGLNTLKMGKRGAGMAKKLKAIIPQLSAVADKIGWKKVFGTLIDFSQDKNFVIAATTVGMGTMGMAILGDINNMDPDLMPEEKLAQ